MLIIAKTVIVMASPRRLWSKPTWTTSSPCQFGHQSTWWCILILKIR